MIKKVVTMLVLAIAIPAFAQHQVVLKWTNSTDTANTFVFRASGSCPTSGVPTGASQLNATPITTATYTDTAVSAGQIYCYYVMANLNGTMSPPSNTTQQTIPVAAPTGLSINQVSLNTNGGNSQVVASWKDNTGVSTNWQLVDNKNNLLAYGSGLSSGNMSWGGKREKSVTLTVCDPSSCVSQTTGN